jgi:hypothetical protein
MSALLCCISVMHAILSHCEIWLETFEDIFGGFQDTTISFLNSSNQRIASFKSFCLAARVRPRKFGLDMDVRWNSTYIMLKHLLPYKYTFSVFIHTNYRVSVALCSHQIIGMLLNIFCNSLNNFIYPQYHFLVFTIHLLH